MQTNPTSAHPGSAHAGDPAAAPFRLGRRGGALLLAIVFLPLLAAVGLLAMDVGAVMLAEAQVQTAADAAARHAARGPLPSDQPGNNDGDNHDHFQAAAAHQANLMMLPESFEMQFQSGLWDAEAGRFTATRAGGKAGGNAAGNALRVVARADAPLAFGWLIGRPTLRVSGEAIALRARGAAMVIGLDRVTLHQNTRIDSYDSRLDLAGSAGLRGDGVRVGSNGPITTRSNGRIHGDVELGPNGSASGNVSGVTHRREEDHHAAPPTLPETNDNARIPARWRKGDDLAVGTNHVVTLPAGTYVFDDVTIGSNSTLAVSGQVTLYVRGRLHFRSNSQTSIHAPEHLQIRVVGAGPVTFQNGKGANIYASVLAPDADVRINSNSHLFGDLIARTIDLKSGAEIHGDEALAPKDQRRPMILVR